LLAQHPRVLGDLRAELARVLVGAAPALEQLADLPVLDRIVKESLRLFPPVSIDCCMLSTAVELGPYPVPEGTIVVYSPYITHHLPDRYLNPQHFRPERWLYIEPERHEYLPFGASGNLDDAAAMAILHTKLILAMIVQRYTLGLAPGTRIEPSVGVPLVPKGGLAMVIAPPDRSVTRRIPQGVVREMVILP
jgi:cytochrome P450